MKTIFFISAISYVFFTYSQDISGFWKGDIYQGSKHFNVEASFWKIDSIHYRSFMKIIDFEEYGLFQVEALLKNNNIRVEDKVLVRDYSPNRNHWCYKTGELKYDSTQKRVKLRGKWIGSCVNGTINLKRIKEPECDTEQINSKQSIVNGNFEQRYNGFTSHFPIDTKSSMGRIKVVRDAKELDKKWIGQGKGCFLAIDGDVSSQKGIWIQKIKLDPSNYKVDFSFDLSNLDPIQEGCRVQVFVDGKVIGHAKCPSANNKWENHTFSFTSDRPDLMVSIQNQRITLNADHFGIDNIKMTQYKNDTLKLSLFHEQNIFRLNTNQIDSLKQITQTLRSHHESKVHVVGYASDIGASLKNLKLSQKRVNEIVKLLISEDIENKRITTNAQGEVKLVDTRAIETQRNQNRRVDIIVSDIIQIIDK